MKDYVLDWLKDNVNFGIFTTDEHFIIDGWNRWLELNTGMKADYVLGKGLFELWPTLKDSFIFDYYKEALEGKTSVVSQKFHKYIIPIKLKEKNNHYFTHMQQSGIISSLLKHEKVIGTITILKDVTDRVITEKRLAEIEERYRRFIEASPDMIFLKDENFRYVLANKAYLDFVGKDEKDIIGKTAYECMPKELAKKFSASDRLALEKDSLILTEETSDGKVYEIRKFPVTLPDMKKGIGGFIHDVTEIKENINNLKGARERFQHLSLVLWSLLEINKLITQEKNIETLVGNVCKILVEKRSYNHALILLSEGYDVIASCSAVYDKSDMETLERSVKYDIPDCFKRALKARDIVIVDPFVDCVGCPLLKNIREEKCELVRIEYNAKIYGILNISLSTKFIDNQEEKELFMRVADDLGFAIYSIEQEKERKKAEEELKESYNRLRNIIGSVIDVISLAVESRDPYTAGHQKRVANLARIIAQEMGLSAEQIENVRMAGTIHDLGKIATPAEILSSPKKLTNIEFELVKQHPKNAYDILKNIDYLKTVAEIVYQHHEKLDGSGYPRGLKGDEIMIEAKILCVADVVEAIASHRPYRPSLGIEAALEEIEKNAGILYDETVVYACLKIFREKHFSFE
ncbi:MAG TPA: PAS domain S-box protein [Syntrophorhabdaceae bacterium]|nr:PAS domain S-box protein [Syntrophorhabdaceae bacterium]